MTARSVIHDTFTIERTYPAAPSRVFAAFASEQAKSVWGDTGGLEPAEGEAGISEFDFRPGGRERTALTVTEQGAYLDGIDGAQAPALRKGGTAEMLDNLTSYLAAQAAP